MVWITRNGMGWITRNEFFSNKMDYMEWDVITWIDMVYKEWYGLQVMGSMDWDGLHGMGCDYMEWYGLQGMEWDGIT
jgi:hypothetical protein